MNITDILKFALVVFFADTNEKKDSEIMQSPFTHQNQQTGL